MSYPSAPGLDDPWDGWLPQEAYEAGINEALERATKLNVFEVNDDNLRVWACLAEVPQVADREECEIQGCSGPHHEIVVGRKCR